MAQINGTWQPGFGDVYRAFEQNFEVNGEVGAAVNVTVGGQTVVDLWGGVHAGKGDEEPWQADTLVPVFSCTKGATAIAAHVLISAGKLDLEAHVIDYWPEFGAAGKERATVAMMLDHSVGLPTLRAKLPKGSVYDWDEMVSRLQGEAPFWEPGTRNGYHMLTFGWTVGELVRRASGGSLGTFFREAVAKPAGADVWIGLPEAEEHRVAKIITFQPDPDKPSEFTLAVRADRSGISARALLNQGGFNPNSREAHAAEVGGGGGLASARGLAAMYRPLAMNDGTLVRADHLPYMSEVAVATHRDATLLMPTRFSLGFMKSMDNRRNAGDKDSAILSSGAFGHVGAGGSIGFADPVAKMSFGYAMNKMGPGLLLNKRGQGLVDALYRSLGYRNSLSGVWVP